MDYEITFTLNQLILFITTIGGVITMVAAVTTIIFKLVNRAKAPEVKQDERITALEEKQKEFEDTIATFRQYFTNDDNRFKAIEKSNKITQSALLALLKHALNGNDVGSIQKAEKQLEAYLIDK